MMTLAFKTAAVPEKQLGWKARLCIRIIQMSILMACAGIGTEIYLQAYDPLREIFRPAFQPSTGIEGMFAYLAAPTYNALINATFLPSMLMIGLGLMFIDDDGIKYEDRKCEKATSQTIGLGSALLLAFYFGLSINITAPESEYRQRPDQFLQLLDESITLQDSAG